MKKKIASHPLGTNLYFLYHNNNNNNNNFIYPDKTDQLIKRSAGINRWPSPHGNT